MRNSLVLVEGKENVERGLLVARVLLQLWMSLRNRRGPEDFSLLYYTEGTTHWKMWIPL